MAPSECGDPIPATKPVNVAIEELGLEIAKVREDLREHGLPSSLLIEKMEFEILRLYHLRRLHGESAPVYYFNPRTNSYVPPNPGLE